MAVDRKLVAAGLYDALEVADLEYRARKPALFRKVDRILAGPRVGQQDHADRRLDTGPYRIAECLCCAARFVSIRTHGRWSKACSDACQLGLRRYYQRHGRTA